MSRPVVLYLTAVTSTVTAILCLVAGLALAALLSMIAAALAASIVDLEHVLSKRHPHEKEPGADSAAWPSPVVGCAHPDEPAR